MIRSSSIRFRLSLVFLLFLMLVVILGLFSIARLKDFNNVSSDIRDRWLQNTRYLGDLNNNTSDFRAAEATHILSQNKNIVEKEITRLDGSILQNQRGYGQIYHDPQEKILYQQFEHNWQEYRQIADQVLSLSRTVRKAAALQLYTTNSQLAYNTASDTLGLLTNQNVANARQASNHADLIYHQSRILIYIAIFIAALMVIIAIWYISYFIFYPLIAIATSMRQLAKNETDVAIPHINRLDEIGEMARSVVVFQNNAVDLALSRHGLTQQATMLEEKLEQEQHLTTLQRNFIMMASHEFRTPLGVIDGHAQRLIKMKERLSADEISERADKIRHMVLQITSLIDNLLNTTRLFEGDAQLYFHPTKTDLTQLLSDVIHMHHDITPQAQIVTNFGELPLIMADSKLLYQVFSNLVANAVKYSPAGGTIKISTTNRDQYATITIEDHGIGINKADIDLLFERYYRGKNVSGITGTGIGLYLVKMVVELHGGNIAVKSVEGQGSTFTVNLPIKEQ